jgi:hypothetical protein
VSHFPEVFLREYGRLSGLTKCQRLLRLPHSPEAKPHSEFRCYGAQFAWPRTGEISVFGKDGR